MRKINISLYPTKWAALLSEFGEEEAIEKYWKFCRAFLLEKYILKYGKEEGEKLYLEKRNKREFGMSLERSIKQYGIKKGTEVYNNWRKNVAGSLDNFIKRYGEELGKIKYDDFCKKCIVKDEIKINKDSKYNNRKHNTRICYYIEKGFSKEESEKILAERQSTSTLEKFINIYGEEKGKEKYIETNKKKSNSLENFIDKYGEIIGDEKYLKWLEIQKQSKNREVLIKKYGIVKYNEICKSHAITLEKLIKKYGDKNGLDKYISWLRSRILPVSKISLELFNWLFDLIISDFKYIYYGKNEYMFFINSEKIKMIKPDFYIKDINLAIEFYGDYWHRNPQKFNKDEDILIREKDKKRIEIAQEKFGVEFIIIWQSDFVKEPEIVINSLLKQIYQKRGN